MECKGRKTGGEARGVGVVGGMQGGAGWRVGSTKLGDWLVCGAQGRLSGTNKENGGGGRVVK